MYLYNLYFSFILSRKILYLRFKISNFSFPFFLSSTVNYSLELVCPKSQFPYLSNGTILSKVWPVRGMTGLDYEWTRRTRVDVSTDSPAGTVTRWREEKEGLFCCVTQTCQLVDEYSFFVYNTLLTRYGTVVPAIRVQKSPRSLPSPFYVHGFKTTGVGLRRWLVDLCSREWSRVSCDSERPDVLVPGSIPYGNSSGFWKSVSFCPVIFLEVRYLSGHSSDLRVLPPLIEKKVVIQRVWTC